MVDRVARLASDVGVSPPTIQSYYEILVDCLVAERVDPISRSATRKKLTKSRRFLLFDMGVRRLAAGEGARLGAHRLAELFEQVVGLELIRSSRLHAPARSCASGGTRTAPEVDWVLEHKGRYVPIEVKWSERPTQADARHLHVFLDEYKNAKSGFVVCRCVRPYSSIHASPRSRGRPSPIRRRASWATCAEPPQGRAHGGRVDVESEPGKGTHFAVMLQG